MHHTNWQRRKVAYKKSVQNKKREKNIDDIRQIEILPYEMVSTRIFTINKSRLKATFKDRLLKLYNTTVFCL